MSPQDQGPKKDPDLGAENVEDTTQVVSAEQVRAQHVSTAPSAGDSASSGQVQAQVADEWLIRTSQSFLAGPYTRLQICQMIHDRKLALQDEVCQASNYWFYLHEVEEVRKFLGVEMPRLPDSGEEKTQTETTQVDVTDPDLVNAANTAKPPTAPPSVASQKESTTLERPAMLRIIAAGLGLLVVLLVVAILRSVQ